MEATRLLIEGHERIKDLLRRADEAGDADELSGFINEISQEIEAHANAEEQVLYPLFYDSDRELIETFYDAHQEIRDAVNELKSEAEYDRAQDLLGKLTDSFEEHVQEEEEYFFPMVEQRFTLEQREQLGQELQAEKAKLTNTKAA